jgi:hypothetical protein
MKKTDNTPDELDLNGLKVSAEQCHAPNIIDVEEAYLSVNSTSEFEVVVSRPSEDSPSITTYRRLAEYAGFGPMDWSAAAFLNFSFSAEEEAREFVGRLPKGMVTIYKGGKLFDVNC